MAAPDLDLVVAWFESNFDTVIEINERRPDLLVLIDGRLKFEGEQIDWLASQPADAVTEWLKSAMALFELRGKPKQLVWRKKPAWEDGHIYSRFAM